VLRFVLQELLIGINPVDPLAVRVAVVKTKLITDDDPDKEASADPKGKAKDIDQRMNAIADQRTPGAGHIAFEHVVGFSWKTRFPFRHIFNAD
jgi:hypothetical protein